MTDQENSPMDYPQHEGTYENFLTLTKWACGIVAGILALMGLFIVNTPVAMVVIGGLLLVALLIYML